MTELRNFPLSIFLSLALIMCLNQVTAFGCQEYFENGDSNEAELLEPSAKNRPMMDLTVTEPKRYNNVSKILHKLNHNVVLLNMTRILTVRLDCSAPYPIDLRFSGHLTNQETTVNTFRKEVGSGDELRSCFIITATMESYEEITGNYSCISVDNPSIFSSYYIFVSVNPPGVILTRGQKIDLRLKPEDKKITFPCAISHPNVHVQLLKDGTPIQPSNFRYDPRLGFTMKVDVKDVASYGAYSCFSELSANDYVNFTVLPPKNFAVQPPIKHFRLLPNQRVSIACKAVDEFIITTTPPTIPYIVKEVTLHRNASDMTVYKYIGSFESKPLPPNTSGYVACKWQGSNKSFAEWSFSVQDGEPVKPGHWDKTKFASECPQDAERILYECSNTVECKINSCVRKDSSCKSNSRLCTNDKSCMRNGHVQCLSSGVVSMSDIFFTGFPYPPASNQTSRFVEWEHAAEEEILLLEELLSPYPIKTEDYQLKYSCQGSNFVFSSGFKWFLVFENETRSAISTDEENAMNISVNHQWKEKKSNLESTLTLPYPSAIEQNVTHIECSAPVWNSLKWITRRISIDEKKFSRKRFSKRNSATSVLLLQNTWATVFLITIPTLMSIMSVHFRFFWSK